VIFVLCQQPLCSTGTVVLYWTGDGSRLGTWGGARQGVHEVPNLLVARLPKILMGGSIFLLYLTVSQIT
jgi:hypothetical protein